MKVLHQHRSYRIIARKGLPFWVESILFIMISIVSIYLYLAFFYNQFITYFYDVLVQNNLKEGILSLDVYFFNLMAIDVPFLYNSKETLIVVLLVLLASILILSKQKVIPLNVVFWISFLLLLMIIFVLYFIFFSPYYPYSAEKYFSLYLYAYIGFMFMCFVVLSIILAITPEHFIRKMMVLLFSIGYYFLHSFIRFAMTVLLVSQVSVAFSPLMYFTIFYDFILVIYVYTIMLYGYTRRQHTRRL